MNPVLRDIRRAPTGLQVACLIQKHVGDGSNPFLCKEAYEAAISRLRSPDMKAFFETTHNLRESELERDWCSLVQELIDAIRNWEVISS